MLISDKHEFQVGHLFEDPETNDDDQRNLWVHIYDAV